MIFFDGLDDDPFFVEGCWRFDPPSMVEELGGSDCLGSIEEDSSAVIIGDGCTSLSGLGVVTFDVFLLVFLDEEVAFGVFMVITVKKKMRLRKMNENYGLRVSKVSKVM